MQAFRGLAVHHATSADLDRRGLGAIEGLTVAEYPAIGPLKRLGYRLYRHPRVMLGRPLAEHKLFAQKGNSAAWAASANLETSWRTKWR